MFSSRHGVWLLIAGSVGFLGLLAIQYSTPAPTGRTRGAPQKAIALKSSESKPERIRPRQQTVRTVQQAATTPVQPALPSWLNRSTGQQRVANDPSRNYEGPVLRATDVAKLSQIPSTAGSTAQPSAYPLTDSKPPRSIANSKPTLQGGNLRDFVPRNVVPRKAPSIPGQAVISALPEDNSPSTAQAQTPAEPVRRIPRPTLPTRDRLDATPTHVETESMATKDVASNSATTSADLNTVTPASLVQPIAQGPSSSSQGTTDYRLADQPKVGDHYKAETPTFDRRASRIPAAEGAFSPDAIDPFQPYDPFLNQQVYEGKQLNATQRPLLELGRPWYQLGQLSPGSSLLGFHNNVNPQFLIFGDYRQAIASNTVNGDNSSQMSYELNTFWHFGLTSTERFVTGVAPLDRRNQNTRYEFDNDQFEFETDFDFDFGYLEGDLGAIAGGFVGETLPFDAPFAVGLTPIFLQNGIWLNDAVEGLFFTIPARASALLDISNMDITFAYIYDEINSAAFDGDENAAKAYAIYSFIEALNGYFEVDYAFLEDRRAINRSYHNISIAYTRRFGRYLSNSTRIIANAGQDNSNEQTADGVLLLSENSLITANPYSIVPYFNFFAGFDTPQSAAGDTELLNTGILFESDGMTGFPTLDVSARETAGGAIGLNLLAQDFSQQLILEAAAVFRMDDSQLAGDQYGIGMRYQLPLSNSWIFRTDGMYGFFRNDHDDFGMRMELRKKF